MINLLKRHRDKNRDGETLRDAGFCVVSSNSFTLVVDRNNKFPGDLNEPIVFQTGYVKPKGLDIMVNQTNVMERTSFFVWHRPDIVTRSVLTDWK